MCTHISTVCALTCSLCLCCAANPLSTELAEADTLPRGSFSNLATVWSPSLLRLHAAGRRRAWTITSWSNDARLCTSHTVEGMSLITVTDQRLFQLHSACVRACVCKTFFCQITDVCFHVTYATGLQISPQLEERHCCCLSVAALPG